MNATQKLYRELKDNENAAWKVLSESNSDAASEAYLEARKAASIQGIKLVRWAMGVMQAKMPAAQYAMISDLEQKTARNVAMRQRLIDICMQFNG